MKQRHLSKSCKYLALLMTVAGLALTQLPGCGGIPIPPFPVTINLTGSTIMPADVNVEGEVVITIGAFCDLLDADSLDATIRQAAGDLAADLVQITGAELQSVQVTASAGNFSTFTSATLSLDGASPLQLGAASNSGGLGSSFTLEQATPVDLINDLDGQCGTASARLVGSTPTEAIIYNAAATILVSTSLTPF